MPILASQRRLFDIPDDVAYFNCAYNGPQLKETTRRLITAAEAKARPWERTVASFFDDVECIRGLAARLFGGDQDGYAIVPAASYGVCTAARAVEPRLSAGDRIVVMAEEFPSNVLPWRRAAEVTGASLVTVSIPVGGDWTRAILEQIDERTRVVAVAPCHWTDGAYVDLRTIGPACKHAGAMLVVDATQSLGAVPLPLAEVQPDFLVAGGYKWLLCPYGVSVLYVAEEWRSARPLEETWLARANAQDFTALVRYSDAYMPGARRFDVGEKGTAMLPGAIAALEQLEGWGVENVTATLSAVNADIAARLEPLGFRLPPAEHRAPHMFGAQVPGGRADSLVAELRANNIFVSQRGSAVRFAPHLHVTDRDVERLLGAVEAAMA